MKILALDSSGLVASVAVVTEEKVLGEFTVNNKKTHSQTLLPMVDEVIKIVDMELEELDAIAVAGGPGSFTGLRIGASTAKGLALVLDIPIINVPTVDALAYNFFGTDKLICPMMDARRNQVYTGLYQWKAGNFTVLRPQFAAEVEELAAILNEYENEILFLGDGVEAQLSKFASLLKAPYTIAPIHLSRQRAAALGSLSVEYYKAGRIENADSFEPEYLRMSQAERERAEKQEGMQSMLIRHMQEEDMDQVYAIESNSFSRPWSRESFLQSLRNPSNLYLVVEEEGRILGYCGLWGIVGEGEITNVAVDSRYRNQGVGEAMLRELLRQAGESGIDAFTLEVRLSNISAIHLYHKLGFQDTAIRKNYYDAPVEDALIMWL